MAVNTGSTPARFYYLSIPTVKYNTRKRSPFSALIAGEKYGETLSLRLT